MTIKRSFSNEFLLLWEIVIVMINNGNRTEWSSIQSVITLVLNKSDSRLAVVRFC